MLLLSGGCRKANLSAVKPKASTTDTVKKTPPPFAGKWQLFSSQTSYISYVEEWPVDFQEVVGKDSSLLRYNVFAQRIDSMIIDPNALFDIFSESGNSQQSMSGILHATNSMLIFDMDYPMCGSYYWFITRSTTDELDLISPRFFVMGSCNDDDWMEQTVVKFKRMK